VHVPDPDWTVERWRPGDERPAILHDALLWQPVPGIAALTIDLPALFDDAAR
jgi:hypothetical protein